MTASGRPSRNGNNDDGNADDKELEEPASLLVRCLRTAWKLNAELDEKNDKEDQSRPSSELRNPVRQNVQLLL